MLIRTAVSMAMAVVLVALLAIAVIAPRWGMVAAVTFVIAQAVAALVIVPYLVIRQAQREGALDW